MKMWRQWVTDRSGGWEVSEVSIQDHLLCNWRVGDFLKLTFAENVGADRDSYHDDAMALCEDLVKRGQAARSLASTICIFPFQVLHDIQAACTGDGMGVTDAIRDAAKTFQMYMFHEQRAVSRERHMKGMFSMLREEHTKSNAIVAIDYKMKFDAMRYRESSVEWFRKHRISWHIAVVFTRKNHDGGVASTDRPSEHVDYELNVLLLDEIIEKEQGQNVVTVCSILDEFITRIR